MIILPLETYFVVGRVCFFTLASERPCFRHVGYVAIKQHGTLGWWSWCWFQAWWIQAFGQERVLRTDRNLQWHPGGVEFSIIFLLDSVEIYRFSASKVVITSPFLIRPLISCVGVAFRFDTEISHRVITKSCPEDRHKFFWQDWLFTRKGIQWMWLPGIYGCG